MAEFAKACDCAWEDQNKPPKERGIHHLLLLGQGGSGKTHVMQKLVFDVVGFIWPPPSPDEPTMHVVAFSNAQAKNISTEFLKTRTIHNACCMRVQRLENPKMRPGNKQKSLTRLWDKCMVLVIEEISMVSAPLYNMLDFRSMYGRSKTHEVHEHNYAQYGNAFGKVPIVIHLGDFLQLKPTANISLIDDLNAKDDDGEYCHQDVSVEVQHACRLFTSIPFVIELHGTKRFVPGDPLIDFLGCMRTGSTITRKVWRAFEATFAIDLPGELDPRHLESKFMNGYGMSMYWETLSRWSILI